LNREFDHAGFITSVDLPYAGQGWNVDLVSETNRTVTVRDFSVAGLTKVPDTDNYLTCDGWSNRTGASNVGKPIGITARTNNAIWTLVSNGKLNQYALRSSLGHYIASKTTLMGSMGVSTGPFAIVAGPSDLPEVFEFIKVT